MQPYRLQEVRLRLVRSRRRPFSVKQPADVARRFASLAREPRESFWVLFLNAANEVVCIERLSHGDIGSTPAQPAEVVRSALLVAARALILVHHHTSGAPQPSRDDRQTTQAIARAARLFNITLLDHVIVGTRGRYYSFADAQELPIARSSPDPKGMQDHTQDPALAGAAATTDHPPERRNGPARETL